MAGRPGAICQVSSVLHPEELGVPSKAGLFDSAAALYLPHQRWLAALLLTVKRQRLPDQRLLQLTYLELLDACIELDRQHDLS